MQHTPKHKIQDRDLEIMMGNLLRYGVLTSLMVVLIGELFICCSMEAKFLTIKPLSVNPGGCRKLKRFCIQRGREEEDRLFNSAFLS
jgi:hypothetical protein